MCNIVFNDFEMTPDLESLFCYLNSVLLAIRSPLECHVVLGNLLQGINCARDECYGPPPGHLAPYV
jgi:hypothetical protein